MKFNFAAYQRREGFGEGDITLALSHPSRGMGLEQAIGAWGNAGREGLEWKW